MKEYAVKLRNGERLVVVGQVFLFDSKCVMPLRKEFTHYFNSEDVVYISEIKKE